MNGTYYRHDLTGAVVLRDTDHINAEDVCGYSIEYWNEGKIIASTAQDLYKWNQPIEDDDYLPNDMMVHGQRKA